MIFSNFKVICFNLYFQYVKYITNQENMLIQTVDKAVLLIIIFSYLFNKQPTVHRCKDVNLIVFVCIIVSTKFLVCRRHVGCICGIQMRSCRLWLARTQANRFIWKFVVSVVLKLFSSTNTWFSKQIV